MIIEYSIHLIQWIDVNFLCHHQCQSSFNPQMWYKMVSKCNTYCIGIQICGTKRRVWPPYRGHNSSFGHISIERCINDDMIINERWSNLPIFYESPRLISMAAMKFLVIARSILCLQWRRGRLCSQNPHFCLLYSQIRRIWMENWMRTCFSSFSARTRDV